MRRRAVTSLLIVLCALAACGASQRERTIKMTLVAVNATRDSLPALDLAAQRAILAACNPPTCDKAEFDRRVAEYRAKREEIGKAFEATYQAILTAAVLSDDKKSIAVMLESAKAIGRLLEAAKKLTGQ